MIGPLCLETLHVATPLILAAMGGFVCERSGVINIALEGFMLVGAFAASVCALTTHSPWLGAIGGALAGAVLAAIYGLFVIELESDQIVAGTGINILAAGIPPFICKLLYDVTGSTPGLPMSERFRSAPMIFAWILVGALALWRRFSISGMWVQFAGEKPEALQSAGISVRLVRWSTVLTSGLFAGLGGSSLSLFLASSYSRDMTAGRGFMALAALIFGKWRPIPAALACVLFGFTDALQSQLQGVSGLRVPVELIQVLPYIITILVLAGFVGQSRPPKSIGKFFQ